MGVIHIVLIQQIFVNYPVVHARHCATNWVFRAYRFQLTFSGKSNRNSFLDSSSILKGFHCVSSLGMSDV